MYVYVYVYIHIYIYVCICLCVCICTYTFYVIIYMYTNSFPISYVQYRNIHRIGSDEQHWGQTRLRRTRYYVVTSDTYS